VGCACLETVDPLGGSDGNARLTASTAVVLSVLLAAEGLTLFGVRQLLLPHIFLGLVLVPPVLLKIASTSWRMTSYYRRVEDYVRKGPPHVLLRVVVAPVLVLSTIALFASGIAAAVVGHGGLLLGIHKASFVVWGIAFGIHFLAHLSKLVPLTLRDWWHDDRLRGRRARKIVLGGSLVAGLALAIAAFPLAHHWQPDLFGGGADDR
jgi:hypothetical protein